MLRGGPSLSEKSENSRSLRQKDEREEPSETAAVNSLKDQGGLK